MRIVSCDLRLVRSALAALLAVAITGCASTDSPTSRAGRGKPSLSDPKRPAAWILIDGKAGEFGEDGIEWIINDPVSPTPSFQVDVSSRLIKAPASFDGILTRVEPKKPRSDYLISLATLSPGVEYTLTAAADGMVVRSFGNRKKIEAIGPLEAGSYMLTGTVRNAKTGKQALAVTRFNVGGAAPASEMSRVDDAG